MNAFKCMTRPVAVSVLALGLAAPGLAQQDTGSGGGGPVAPGIEEQGGAAEDRFLGHGTSAPRHEGAEDSATGNPSVEAEESAGGEGDASDSEDSGGDGEGSGDGGDAAGGDGMGSEGSDDGEAGSASEGSEGSDGATSETGPSTAEMAEGSADGSEESDDESGGAEPADDAANAPAMRGDERRPRGREEWRGGPGGDGHGPQHGAHGSGHGSYMLDIDRFTQDVYERGYQQGYMRGLSDARARMMQERDRPEGRSDRRPARRGEHGGAGAVIMLPPGVTPEMLMQRLQDME